MSETMHMERDGVRDGLSPRHHKLVAVVMREAANDESVEVELAELYHPPVKLTARFVPEASAYRLDESLAEEDAHFEYMQSLAAYEDEVIDLRDDDIAPTIATSEPSDVSTPVALSEEDFNVGHFHRDASEVRAMKERMGIVPSVADLVMRTGLTQADFDGLSSAQSDAAISIRDRALL